MSVQFNPNFGITKEEWDKLSPAEQQSKADAFNAAEQAKLTAGLAAAKKGPTITIDGEEYPLDANNPKFNWMIGKYFPDISYEERATLLDKTPDELGLAIKARVQKSKLTGSDGRTDQVLALNKDRYAKLDNFEKQEKLPEKCEIYGEFEKAWPKDKYPKLYKKDGTLNEKKAWQQFEDEIFLDRIYGGKSIETRVKDLMAQNEKLSETEAREIVDAQNAAALKAEKKIAGKQYNRDYQLTAEEQRIVDARQEAHDAKKYTKKFVGNVEKVTKRINNAIDKMNNWKWDDLKPAQQEKVREAYHKYMNDQNDQIPDSVPEIFDESGNLIPEKKNHFYQFVMDYVTGTDAQVNKSRKKGSFLQKLFTPVNAEGTEKGVSKNLGLDKKDIEHMGFIWENQIGVGKMLIDGLDDLFLGAAFGAAMHKTATDVQTAVAETPEQVIDEMVRGEGHGKVITTDYVNGETYTHVTPYTCETLTRFVKVIPGVIQTADAVAKASVTAVLPGALIGAAAGMLNSAIQQGINGQEKDVFNQRLYHELSTGGKYTLTSPEQLVEKTGASLDSPEGKLARDIAEFYFDKDTGEFDKRAFITDWQYNGGYKSDYLNTSEAAMWLEQLRKNGGIKRPETNVTVNIPPQIVEQVVTNINNEFFNNKGEKVQVLAIEGEKTEAAGVDVALVTKKHKNPQGLQLDENIPLSVNKQAALNTNGKTKVQMVLATEGTEVVPNVVNGENDYKTPQKVIVKDKTNNSRVYSHVYELEGEKDGKPIYVETSVIDENGEEIKLNHREEFTLKVHEHKKTDQRFDEQERKIYITTANFYEYDFWQYEDNDGTNNSDIPYTRKSNWNGQL